jgi:adenine-specific DNA methylase
MNLAHLESATKLRGGYYTPPSLASFLARWVLEIRPRRLLEPSCGDGAFFAALAALAAMPGGGGGRVESLLGFELDAVEAEKARRRAVDAATEARVVCGDYLEWTLGEGTEPGRFDAVLGNPPFIRYQYLDERTQAHAARLFERCGIPFTRHTNAWVPFVVAALSQLAPGGRLGMVVPAELLHVLHAQALRDLLIATCSRVVVVDLGALCFEDALQGVVLLMAERAAQPSAPAELALVQARGLGFLADAPARLLAQADFAPAGHLNGKWMTLLLSGAERSLLSGLAEAAPFQRMDRLAEVDVGIVTGANKFFLVNDEALDHHGLRPWAHPAFGRSLHVRGVVYDQESHDENRRLGLPAHFVQLGTAERDSLPPEVQRYVAQGEADGLDRRFKCRIRSPWYNVPSVFSAPVGMLKRAHTFPRLLLNQLGAYSTDTAYRVWPSPGVDAERLVSCFVNSATALTAELEGRHYGGGVLELVPSEIERLLIPMPERERPALRELDLRFRSGEPPERILEAQDGAVLGAAGVAVDDQVRLRAAWDRLRRRRQRAEPVEPEV